MQPMMYPFEVAAKMWRMAPAMIATQEKALGHGHGAEGPAHGHGAMPGHND